MALIGLVIDGKPTQFKDVPVDVFPPELVNALWPHDKREGLHVSDLTSCPYKVSKGKFTDFFWTVDTAYRVVRGVAWDRAIQLFPREGGIYQQKFVRKLDGVEIEGTPDVLDPTLKTCEDYKAPARMYYQIPNGYIIQLNAYVWISYPTLDWEVEALYLNCVGPTGYRRMEVPIWAIRDTSMFLRQRVGQLQTLLDRKSTDKCADPSCFYCHKDTSIFV